MEEEEIHPVPFGAYSQSLLAGEEREVVAQFQEELLQFPDERFF